MAATATARRVRIAATFSAALLGGSLLAGSAVAQAEGTDGTVAAPKRPYGVVIARSGLNERQYPSTDSSVVGVLRYKERVGLDCKVRAQNIQGNTWWYKERGRYKWISARYVKNYGSVRLCKDVHRTALTDSEEARHAMG